MTTLALASTNVPVLRRGSCDAIGDSALRDSSPPTHQLSHYESTPSGTLAVDDGSVSPLLTSIDQVDNNSVTCWRFNVDATASPPPPLREGMGRVDLDEWNSFWRQVEAIHARKRTMDRLMLNAPRIIFLVYMSSLYNVRGVWWKWLWHVVWSFCLLLLLVLVFSMCSTCLLIAYKNWLLDALCRKEDHVFGRYGLSLRFEVGDREDESGNMGTTGIRRRAYFFIFRCTETCDGSQDSAVDV